MEVWLHLGNAALRRCKACDGVGHRVLLALEDDGLEVLRAGKDVLEDRPRVGERLGAVRVVDERQAIDVDLAAARDVHLHDAIEGERIETTERIEPTLPLEDREVRAVEQEPAARAIGDTREVVEEVERAPRRHRRAGSPAAPRGRSPPAARRRNRRRRARSPRSGWAAARSFQHRSKDRGSGGNGSFPPALTILFTSSLRRSLNGKIRFPGSRPTRGLRRSAKARAAARSALE